MLLNAKHFAAGGFGLLNVAVSALPRSHARTQIVGPFQWGFSSFEVSGAEGEAMEEVARL